MSTRHPAATVREGKKSAFVPSIHHPQGSRIERPNVEFRHGYMEELGDLGIGDASFDVVVSNCVFNLSPDKPRLLREILRVLRPGGELFFSDVFANRRIPAPLRDDPVLMGECLSGARLPPRRK